MQEFSHNPFTEGIDNPNTPLEWEEQNKNPDSLNQKESPDPQLTPEEDFQAELKDKVTNTWGYIEGQLDKNEDFPNHKNLEDLKTAIEKDYLEIKNGIGQQDGDHVRNTLTKIAEEHGLKDFNISSTPYANNKLNRGEEVATDWWNMEAKDKSGNTIDAEVSLRESTEQIAYLPILLGKMWDMHTKNKASEKYDTILASMDPVSPYSAETEAGYINNSGNI